MKKLFLFIFLIILLLFCIGIFLDIKDKKKDLPLISILPETIYQGDPVFITINASSTPKELKFDNNNISIFTFDGKSRGFYPIDFNENKSKHNIQLKLSNGIILNKSIDVVLREKIKIPLGIPEKLGGNTQKAGKNLISNLEKENASLATVKSSENILWKYKFQSPLKNLKVTDSYGYNRDTVGYTISHKGTDFHADVGSEVMSVNKGVVVIAKEYIVYGNTVVIDHGLGVSSLYMHLSKINVKEGDVVSAGQVIGLSGKTGYADQPHLHLSIKINGISIDPMKFLAFFGVI